MIRDFTRYIDRLVRGRRPAAFVPTPDEVAAVRAAVELRGAAVEEQEPRPEFVAELRERVAGVAGGASAPGPRPVAAMTGRRGLLIGASTAAAAAVAVAVVADSTVGEHEPPAGPTALDPADGGSWRTVMASAALPENGVVAFDTSVVSGFVMRIAGVLSARSATCTHQGCKLGLNSGQKQLACPCHRTFFAYDGTVIRSQLPDAPAPLPSFHVRELDGEIQVLLPRSR